MIDLPTLFNWLFQTAVAFVSTIAFAIIFHTPKKEWLCCGFTGGVGWLVYLVCMHLNTGVYYTGYHLFMSDNSLALDKGLETIKIAIAIALGIGIVLSLPTFFFTLRRAAPKNRGSKP